MHHNGRPSAGGGHRRGGGWRRRVRPRGGGVHGHGGPAVWHRRGEAAQSSGAELTKTTRQSGVAARWESAGAAQEEARSEWSMARLSTSGGKGRRVFQQKKASPDFAFVDFIGKASYDTQIRCVVPGSAAAPALCRGCDTALYPRGLFSRGRPDSPPLPRSRRPSRGDGGAAARRFSTAAAVGARRGARLHQLLAGPHGAPTVQLRLPGGHRYPRLPPADCPGR